MGRITGACSGAVYVRQHTWTGWGVNGERRSHPPVRVQKVRIVRVQKVRIVRVRKVRIVRVRKVRIVRVQKVRIARVRSLIPCAAGGFPLGFRPNRLPLGGSFAWAWFKAWSVLVGVRVECAAGGLFVDW